LTHRVSRVTIATMQLPLNDHELPLSGSVKVSYMSRILDVLELVALSTDDQLTLTDISNRLEVPLSTTSRLLSQLEGWGFLLDKGNGRYLPGSRLARMSLAVTGQLHSSHRLLESTKTLSAATGESVTGGLIVGDTLLIVARTESEHPVRVVNRVGEVISPTRTALGKAVLSKAPHSLQVQLLNAAGISDPDSELKTLSAELADARENDYAVDEETFAPGLRCRAAAILGMDGGAIGGISIGGPTARYTKETALRTIPLLLRETRELSANLAHTREEHRSSGRHGKKGESPHAR